MGMIGQLLKRFLAVGMIAFTSMQGVTAQTNEESLIAWTMEPVIRQVRTSPNGEEVLILRAASKEGPYVLEIYPADNLKAKPVRFGGGKTDIISATWVADGYLFVDAYRDIRSANRFVQDRRQAIIRSDGRSDWLELDQKHSIDLLDSLPKEPNWILISTDNNNNGIPDLVRFNIRTGAKTTKHRGTDKIPGGFVVDFDGDVRIASAYDYGENAFKFWARKKGETDWMHIRTVTPGKREAFSILGFSRENPNQLIVNTHNGENTTGIYFYDLNTGKLSERIFGHPSYDAGGVIRSRKKADQGKILGFSYTGKYPKTHFINDEAKALYDGIRAHFKDPFVSAASRSEDDKTIIIYTEGPKNPGAYYLLRNKSDLTFIGSKRPLLTEDKLSDVKFIGYAARDGRKIRAYVTTPNTGEAPFPTVVMPHGGPWARDDRVFDEWAQLLANKGYLVIQPQFRGSTGFGLDHWIAGDGKWGLEMQDDLDDAAQFLVSRGLADPARLAMHGFSYGGYTSFVASFRENAPYKCSIAGGGVTDLKSIGASFTYNRFYRELQKPTIQGIDAVKFAKDVRIPLLVMHGDRDRIAHTNHSRWFVDGLKKHNIKDYKYIEIEGMRHGPQTLEHRQIYYSNLLDWLENTCFKQG